MKTIFKNITILDDELEIKTGMDVVVDKDRITHIGEHSEDADVTTDPKHDRIIDGKGRLLMSGFFNAHAHSPMSLLRGYGEDMVLQDWLQKKIFPFEAHLDGGAVYAGTMLAMAESFRTGIVSTSDMYFFCDDMVRAAIDSGAKMNVSRAITSFDDSDIEKTPEGQEMMTLLNERDGAADGRIKVDISAHAEYTNTLKSLRETADFAIKHDAIMHVHLSETRREVEECKERHNGKTPPVVLAECGMFDQPTIAAHSVWLEDNDFEVMKEKGVFVAANPSSNLKLASGVANYPRMLENGIKVALGTDSVASNNSLDFFGEMKNFAIAPKMYYNDPSVMTTDEVLRAATMHGAVAQGRDDTGTLKEGNKADLILIDTDLPMMHPMHDLKANIIYSASPEVVKMTMVDGIIVYENGEYLTIDIEKVIFEADVATEKILKEL